MKFDYEEFGNFYSAKSRYAKKGKLIQDFDTVFNELFRVSLYATNRAYVVKVWNRNQELIESKLLGKGHTAAGVNGMLKLFVEWCNL